MRSLFSYVSLVQAVYFQRNVKCCVYIFEMLRYQSYNKNDSFWDLFKCLMVPVLKCSKNDHKEHVRVILINISRCHPKIRIFFAVFWEKTVFQLSFFPIIFIGLNIPIDCFLVMCHFHYQPLQIYLISFTFEVQVNICQKESIYLLLPTD